MMFTANTAQVTVVRPLASSVYGSYDLSIPDYLDIEEFHQFEADGNELGFVGQLRPEVRTGGFARRFIRADVAVTAEDPKDTLAISESNVDQVLTEVRDRMSEDFFLESDIDLAGLGPWVPFVHFQVGDLVEVNIFGLVVVLPVTRIEPVISEHSIVDWIVHVGGQLMSDEMARIANNADVHRRLVEDRRDLAGLEAQTQKKVAAAQAAADAAAAAAQEALENTDLILEDYIVGPDGLQAQVGTIQQGVTDALEASNNALTQLETMPAEIIDQAKLDFRETLDGEMDLVDQALARAQEALEGRITRSTEAPSGTGTTEGDLWWRVDSAGNVIGQWAWDGSAWKLANFESEVIANLDAGKITSGTIDADRIAANSITGDKVAANAITAEKIMAGSIKADRIEANAFASIGPSLLVNIPGTLTPQWTAAGFQLPANHSWLASRPSEGPHVYGRNDTEIMAVTSPTPVRVISGQRYEFDFWAIGSVGGRIMIRFKKAGVHEGAVAAHGELDGNEGEVRTGTTWGIWVGLTKNLQWQRFRGWIEFAEDTEYVVLDQIEWHQGGTGLGQFQAISGLEVNALMPDQAEIDALQNHAIRNTNRSVGLQQRSVQALAVGENLLPYYEPSLAEVEGGYSTWLMPDWARNAVGIGTDDTVYPGFRWYSYDRTRTGGGTLVPVDNSIAYEFVVWLKGDVGTSVHVEMRDQDGNPAIASGAISTQARPESPIFNESTGRLQDLNTGGTYLVSGLTFGHDEWTRFTTRVTLRPGVREVRIGSVHVSYPSGSPGTAYIGEDMRFRPWEPTPAQVEGIQDYGIRTNSTAISALGEAQAATERAANLNTEITTRLDTEVSRLVGATISASGSSDPSVAVVLSGDSASWYWRPGRYIGGYDQSFDLFVESFTGNGVLQSSQVIRSVQVTAGSTSTVRSGSIPSGGLVRLSWLPSATAVTDWPTSTGAGVSPLGAWGMVTSYQVDSGPAFTLSVDYYITWTAANNTGAYHSRVRVRKPNGTEEIVYLRRTSNPETGLGPYFGDGPVTRHDNVRFNGVYPTGTNVYFDVMTNLGNGLIMTTNNRTFAYTLNGSYTTGA